jgi:hypothetical protein
MDTRKPYPSDVSDEEWEFVAPYLTLLPLDAEQWRHDLRGAFNALRWLVRSGTQRCALAHAAARLAALGGGLSADAALVQGSHCSRPSVN